MDVNGKKFERKHLWLPLLQTKSFALFKYSTKFRRFTGRLNFMIGIMPTYKYPQRLFTIEIYDPEVDEHYNAVIPTKILKKFMHLAYRINAHDHHQKPHDKDWIKIVNKATWNRLRLPEDLIELENPIDTDNYHYMTSQEYMGWHDDYITSRNKRLAKIRAEHKSLMQQNDELPIIDINKFR